MSYQRKRDMVREMNEKVRQEKVRIQNSYTFDVENYSELWDALLLRLERENKPLRAKLFKYYSHIKKDDFEALVDCLDVWNINLENFLKKITHYPKPLFRTWEVETIYGEVHQFCFEMINKPFKDDYSKDISDKDLKVLRQAEMLNHMFRKDGIKMRQIILPEVVKAIKYMANQNFY